MAKKDDAQLDDWRYRYPSAGVSWNLIGDPAYCQQFVGEAKNMLYQLKNRMNIAVPKLKSLQDKRSPVPGTTIIVKSIYGQDFIEISAGEELKGKYSCIITFIDAPLSVPPMKNPGVIKPADVIGIDYFKTYYSIDISKCPTCQKPSWEFLFTYLQSSPLVPLPKPPLPISTRKEWPVEPMHYSVPDAIPPIDEPNNHSIYSLSPPCWGEVISHGTDEGGTYIIWKAYTETGIISRTGLGIMRLVARIKDNTGKEICAQNERIEVDCCLKNADLRKVEIWWEDFGTCQPYINYEGMALCKMPTSVPIGGASGLLVYRVFHKLYAIPEVNGGCLPFEWTASGALSLFGTSKDGLSTGLNVIVECTQPGIIKLKDRCGSTYTVIGAPCCDDAAPLSISYTSLLMSCGGQQTLTAIGGCGPWSWAVTAGGGTISFNPNDSGEAVYTAPATNVNCVDNPTITLTDCCGGSASISLAVNCYTGNDNSLAHNQLLECQGCFCLYGDCNQGAVGCRDWVVDRWKCNGVSLYHCETKPCSTECPSPPSPNWKKVDCTPLTNCWTNQCGCPCVGLGGDCPCNVLYDCRTNDMKQQGCCPLNPLTGLPY